MGESVYGYSDSQTVRQSDENWRIGELENWSRRALKQKSRWVTRYHYSAVPILSNGIASLYLGRWYVHMYVSWSGGGFLPHPHACAYLVASHVGSDIQLHPRYLAAFQIVIQYYNVFTVCILHAFASALQFHQFSKITCFSLQILHRNEKYALFCIINSGLCS